MENTNPFFIPGKEEEVFLENNRGELVGVSHDTKTNILSINQVPMKDANTYVSPSPLGGWGLFANREIKKGERFLQYIGDTISEKEYKAHRVRYGTGYLIEFSSSTIKEQKEVQKRNRRLPIYIGIDAYPYVQQGAITRIGGFANDSSNPNVETRERTSFDNDDYDENNLQFRVWMIALKKIKKGEEILWDYGKGYWRGKFKKTEIVSSTPVRRQK